MKEREKTKGTDSREENMYRLQSEKAVHSGGRREACVAAAQGTWEKEKPRGDREGCSTL